MSLCLIASVQTSLTTPVHLCKILYVPLHAGFPRKKDIFPLCNIKLLCISLLPVYFIKVLQNYYDLLRYNWDLETLSFEWLLKGCFQIYKFVKDFVKFLIFMWFGKKKKECYKGTIWSDWHNKWQFVSLVLYILCTIISYSKLVRKTLWFLVLQICM